MAARLLQENGHSTAQTGLVEGLPLCSEERLEARQTVGFDLVRNLPGHFRRWRTGAGRVFERKGRGIARFPDDAERRFEIGVAFPREADDEVTRQRDVGASAAQAGNELEILFGAMAAIHFPEDA